MKRSRYRLIEELIYLLLMPKAQFHLSRMDIDVNFFSQNLQMQYDERIFVLHGEILIGIFNSF